MATQLTLKQREFVREYVSNGGNGQNAALAVYDTVDDNVARNIASENLTKPNVKTAMQNALAKLELGEENIALAVKDALQATRAIGIGENSEDSKRIVIEVADHHVRLKAAEFAAKLMDAYPMKRTLDSAKRIRQEMVLANEPTEVLEWQVEHGRRPTRQERDLILGVKTPAEDGPK